MDSAATLEQQSCVAEQAIFTSVRSPMGEGYRVVAASPGIDVQHKREITRRSPSHDSLSSSEADARAVSSYVLPDGRVCVGVSGHAGREHTGRGGLRVYTHVIMLDEATYAEFGCYPAAVEHALLARIGDKFDPKPPKRLQTAELVCGLEFAPSVPDFGDAGRVAAIAAAVLEGQRILVCNAPVARDVLNWVMMMMPQVCRRGMTVSGGLKPSPARDFQLVIVENDGGKRIDEGYRIVDWNDPPVVRPTPYRSWIDFVQSLWARGRGADVCQLTRRMTETQPQALERIISVCEDLDQVARADATTLVAMTTRHPRQTHGGGTYADLTDALHEAVRKRSDELAAIAAAEAAAAEAAAKEAEGEASDSAS